MARPVALNLLGKTLVVMQMDTLSKTIQNPITELVELAQETVETSVAAMGEIVSAAGTNSASQTHNTTTNQTMPLHTEGTVDDMLSCCMEVTTSSDNVSKLVLLASGTWTANLDVARVLNIIELPHAFISNSDHPAFGQFQYFRYSRCGYSFRLSVTPCQGCQGALAISYLPPGYQHYVSGNSWVSVNLGSLLSAPYAIADVRTASEVALTVPYVNCRNYVNHSVTDRRRHGGVLVVWQFSKLQIGTSSGSVGWSVYGEMLELDLQCPRLYGQGKKHGRRKKVVPPPRPPVQQHVQIAPGPGSVNLSNSLATRVSESLALVGESTSVDHSSAGSRACYTDLVECCRRWAIIARLTWNQSTTTGNMIDKWTLQPNDAGHIGLIMRNFEFWRGSLELRVMVFGSTMTAGRFQVSWFPDTTLVNPALSQVRNAVYMTADVGAAPSTFVLPFVSQTWRRKTSDPYGRIFVHCVNQLTHNNTAPSDVQVVVLLRAGKDFQLFAPCNSTKQFNNGATEDQMDDEPVYFINYEIEHIPIQSESHTLIKNFFSRQFYYGTETLTENEPLRIWLETPKYSPLQLCRLFAYWTGEVVITVANDSAFPIYVCHQYEDKELGGLRSMAMSGALIVPGYGAKSINVPFYSKIPLRSTEGKQNQWSTDAQQHSPCFGFLTLYSKANTTCTVFLGLKDPNFFFQVPIPTLANFTDQGKKRHNKKSYDKLPSLSYEIPRAPEGWEEQNKKSLREWFYTTYTSRRAANPIQQYFWDLQDAKLMKYAGIPDAQWDRIPLSGDVEENPGPGTKHEVRKNTEWYDWDGFLVEMECDRDGKIIGRSHDGSKKVVAVVLSDGSVQVVKKDRLELLKCGDVESNPGPRDCDIHDIEWSWKGICKKDLVVRNPAGLYESTLKYTKNYIGYHKEDYSKIIMERSRGLPSDPIWDEKQVSVSKWFGLVKEEKVRIKVEQGGGKRFLVMETRSGPLSGRRHFLKSHDAWVPDLTVCGDVEKNPGPWDPDVKHFVMLGLAGSGKSHMANRISGKKAFKEECSANPVTREAKTVTFGNFRITDSPEMPRIDDMVDVFIYVHTPGRGNTREELEYLECLEKQIPNWMAHGIVIFNYRGIDGKDIDEYMAKNEVFVKLTHGVAGRVCCPEDVRKMADECLTTPYHAHLATLVYLDRGLYRHYGVRVGSSVFHLNTHDILKSSLSGTARVTESAYHEDKWKEVDESAYRSAAHFVKSGAVDLRFNIDDNCDSWARRMIGSANTGQGERVKWCLSTAAAAAFIYSGITMDNHSPGMFSKLISSISSHFYGNLENLVIKTVIRTVCRIICYLILYCHSPNLLTTGVIVALIAMDLTSISVDGKVKAACEALANGEFAEFCSQVIDLTDDPDYVDLRNTIPKFNGHARTLSQLQKEAIALEYERQKSQGMGSIKQKHPLHDDKCLCIHCIPPASHKATDKCECKFCLDKFGPLSERNTDGTLKDQGKPKSFNEWTTCAKNIQWWIEGVLKVFKWLKEKLFPPDIDQQLREIEAQSSEIATIMACCDEHIVRCRTDKNYVMDKNTRKKQQVLVDKMSELLSHELPGQLSHFGAKLNQLMQRLQALSLEPPLEYTHRAEPLGIWIQGEPGSGKSFLANYIVKKVCERFGWDAYSQPIGSDHMDGYNSQEVHVFDDLGQNRDEEDMALMCNLISSVPFIVPKADLTSKGTTYNGRLVVVTTNKSDFSSIKLAESSALQRRFPVVLHVRPSQAYERTDSHGKVRFNAVNATMDGSLKAGTCWDRNVAGPKYLTSYSECWVKLDPDILLKEIFDELDSRTAVCDFMNQGKPDLKLDSDEMTEFDKFFPDPPRGKCAKIRSFIMESIQHVKAFVERNKTWFIAAGALGTIISLGTMIIPMIRKWMKKPGEEEEQEEESFYSGKAAPLKIKNFKIPMQNQGPVDMKPIVRSLVNVTDETGELTTALALGGKTIILHGHESFSRCVAMGDEDVDFALTDATRVQFNGDNMDLVQYQVQTPYQFKSVNHKIYDKEYKGDGYLVWKERKGYSYLPVFNIHPTNTLITTEGTTTEHTYTYIARTWKGSCGAVLVGIVEGNPKILGIHIAGNKNVGAAARLFPVFNQGKVVDKSKSAEQYYQPRKTKYEPSPVHTGRETVAPAVLSRNDPRLEVPIDDVTKLAAAKYIGNHFDPPKEVFALAKAVVIDKMKRVVKQVPSMTFEEATSSERLPIDWQTSPGLKYLGCTKAILVKDPKFKDDVMNILAGDPTFFTTYLKDELRPVEKVASGNTRAIEAANFDYVVAWRMVMGNIVAQLMNDQDRTIGFAPGINPYTHFDSLMDNVKYSVLNLDFKKFDGSLSPELMREAVDVLACFHYNPSLVKMIHEPTINSINLVSDETWIINGGMCSGSPCTTVLNTVCNLLVNYTVILSCGVPVESIYIAGYGDDTILSIDWLEALPDTRVVQEKYLNYFGMTVTSATKGDRIEWVPKNQVEFLKRTATVFPFTCKIVGKLNLQSMMDHIGWTKGSFQEQLDSFYQELVIHGPKVYNEVREKMIRRAPSFNHPSFEAMYNIMKPVVMVF